MISMMPIGLDMTGWDAGCCPNNNERAQVFVPNLHMPEQSER